MGGGDVVSTLEVGDGAGEFDEAVVGAGGETHGGDGLTKQVFAGLIEGAELAEEGAIHLGIGENSFSFEASPLDLAGALDASADVQAPLGIARGFELVKGDARDFDVEVDSVHNGAGNTRFVATCLARRAGTEALGVAQIPAGAGVHRGNQDETRGKMKGAFGSRNRDVAVFEGLPQIFQDILRKFAEFIEEKDAAVRETYFTRLGEGTAAD